MAGRMVHLAAATAAVANRYVTSTNMINGAYTLANTTPPTAGAYRVTITHTTQTGADTLGVITVVGTNTNGATVTDVITPIAGSVATGLLFFRSITSITGSGWSIVGGNDTITAGTDARCIVADISGGLSGTLYNINVNTTAAGTVTVKDSTGTLAILKASIAEGNYQYNAFFSDFLEIVMAAASDVTIVVSP